MKCTSRKYQISKFSFRKELSVIRNRNIGKISWKCNFQIKKKVEGERHR